MKKTHSRITHFFIIFIFFAIIPMVLSNCKQHAQNQPPEFFPEENRILTIPELNDMEINDVYVFNSHVYLIADNNCFIYDLSAESVANHPYGGSSICVDDSNIYISTTDNRSLLIYSKDDFSLIEEHHLDIPQINILNINKLLPINDALIIEVLYLNSEGFSESNVFEYHPKSKTITNHTESFKGSDSYSLLMSITPKDNNTVVFVSIANTSFTNTITKSYTYNIKKQTIQDEFIFDFNFSQIAYDNITNCYFYSDDSYTIKRYNRSEDCISTVATLKKEEIGDSQYIDNFFISNGHIFLFKNTTDILSVINTELLESALHILAYESIQSDFNINKIIEQFESKYNTPVYVTTYDSTIFKDTLRTKFLSKSNDFDIVFIDNPTESNFLASIVNYELFSPLNTDDQINENFTEMYMGITEMVSINGSVIGVPYYITISNLLSCTTDSEINPDFDFTLPMLWEFCEKLSPTSEYSLLSDPYMMLRFLTETIQDQIASGTLQENEVVSLLSNIKHYYDSDILFSTDIHGNALKRTSSLFTSAPQFFSSFIFGSNKAIYPSNGVVSYPYANNKYIELNGLAMINKYSASLDSAYKFIATMTEHDNIYSTGTSGIYKFTLLGKHLEKNLIYHEWSQNDIEFLSVLPQLYENSRIYTFDHKSFMNFVRENLMTDFYSGLISPEDAASKIITFVEYTYFE